MDAAQLITIMDAEVGFGLLSFYSAVVDAVATMVLAMAVVVVATTMAIAANGLSFFLFFSAAAVMAVPAANLNFSPCI